MLLLYMSDRMNLYDSAKEHRISEKSEVLCFFFLQNGGNYGETFVYIGIGYGRTSGQNM